MRTHIAHKLQMHLCTAWSVINGIVITRTYTEKNRDKNKWERCVVLRKPPRLAISLNVLHNLLASHT